MQKQRYALVKREYRVPFILVTSLFFLWGFAHAILDVLNKHFQDVLVISRTHSAWLCSIWDILLWLFLPDYLSISTVIVVE